MVDAGALFAKIEAVVGSLIDTSGTLIDVDRLPDGLLTGDALPDTLTVGPVTSAPLAANVGALLVPAGAGDALGLPAAPEAQPGDYRMVTRPELGAVEHGDLVRVRACRELALIDRAFLVRGRGDSSAGAVHLFTLAPVLLRVGVPEA